MDSNFSESDWYDNLVLHELDILGDGPEFIRNLIKNFEKDGAHHVLNLKKAMLDDYLEYRDSLHALKGSATELSAYKLVEVCQEAERLKPYELGSEKISQMCFRIEEVFNETVTALKNAVTVEQSAYSSKESDR